MNDGELIGASCRFCRKEIRVKRKSATKRRRRDGERGGDLITSQMRQHQTKENECMSKQVAIVKSKSERDLMNLRLPILYEAITRKNLPPFIADSVIRLRQQYTSCSKASMESNCPDDDVSMATGEPIPISQADLVNRSYGADEHFITAGVKECLKYKEDHRKTSIAKTSVSCMARDNMESTDDVVDEDDAFKIHDRDDDESSTESTSLARYNAIESAEREYNEFANGCNWAHIRSDALPFEVAIQPRPHSPISLCSHDDGNDEYQDDEDYEAPPPDASHYLYQHPNGFDVDENTDEPNVEEQELLVPTEDESILSEEGERDDSSIEDPTTNGQRQAPILPTPLSPFLIPTLDFFENHRNFMKQTNNNRLNAIDMRVVDPKFWSDWVGPKHMVTSDEALLRCLLMHDELKSPHWGFRRSLCWVQFMVDVGLLTRTSSGMLIKTMHRETFMRRIRSMFFSPPYQECIVPLENKATRDFHHAKIWFDPEENLEDYIKCLDGYAPGQRGSAKVPVCSVKESILDLLQDAFIFSDLDNLVVNRGGDNEKEDVFKPFESGGMVLDEFLTGDWYTETKRRLRAYFKDDESFDIFLMYFPVALFIDKTGTDLMQRHGLEPVYVTSLMIKLRIRQLYRAWRLIGFIPDQELMSKSESAAQRRGPDMKGTSCRNWHMCLKSILEELIELEKTGFVTSLKLGPYCKKVRIIPVVALIMGDAKGGDTLTCRFGSHGRKVGRQIRSCWCSFINLDNTEIRCHPILAYQTHFPSCLAYSNGFTVIEPKGFVHKEKRVAVDRRTQQTAIPNAAGEEPNRSIESDTESDADSYRDIEIECDSDEEECSSGFDTPNYETQRRSSTKPKARKKARTGPRPKKKVAANEVSKASLKRQRRAEAIAGRIPIYKRGEPIPFDSFFQKEPFFNHQSLMEELGIYDKEDEPPAYERNDQLSKSDLDKVWVRFRQTYPTAEDGGRLLHEISQHQCITSFNQLSFGGDIHGIHGATPCDPLHAIKLGLIKYSANHLLSLMTPVEKEIIDTLCRTMLRSQRQSERRWFPRSNFSHALTSLTMLTADEWVGVIFSLAIIFRTDAGFAILEKVKKRPGTLPKETTPDDLVYALEMLLSFEAWVFGGPYWRNDQPTKKDAYDKSVRKMLAFVKKHIRRDEGYGWCVSKFHEMLHIVPNIQRNGRPSGYDSSIGERQLKHTKSASRTAQKQRYESFLTQTCHRITDEQSLLKAAMAVGGIPGYGDNDSGDGSDEDDVDSSMFPPKDTRAQEFFMGMAPSFTGQKRIVFVPNQNTTIDTFDTVRHVVWAGAMSIDMNRQRYTFVCDKDGNNPAPTQCVVDALGKFISTKLLFARKTELNRIANLEDCAIHGEQIKAYWQEARESHEGQNRNKVPSDCVVHVRLRAFSEAHLHGRYNNKEQPETLLHKRYEHIKSHGLLIRNHPNYRRSGAWNDWVIVKRRCLGITVRRIKKGRDDCLFIDTSHVPARLLALVEWQVSNVIAAKPTPLPHILPPTERDSHSNKCSCTTLDYKAVLCMGKQFTCAVVHPCTMADSKYCSVLFDEWHLASKEHEENKSGHREEKLYSPYSVCVPLWSVSDRVFVVSPKGYSFEDTVPEGELDRATKVYVLRDRESAWGTRF